MKFQNPSLNSVLNGRKDERTSRKQYAPHFFKVGGIIIQSRVMVLLHDTSSYCALQLCEVTSK